MNSGSEAEAKSLAERELKPSKSPATSQQTADVTETKATASGAAAAVKPAAAK